MLVFLRHAERGDNQFPQQASELPFDPPITTSSTSTIARTAHELLQIFHANAITAVEIVCSKFLRCLMTAEQIAKLISQGGISIKKPYTINNQVGQYMREDWFSEYPLHKLIYDGDHRTKYIKDSIWNELPLDQPLPFPENYVMFHQRIGRYKDKLTFPPQGQCTLVVTHGFVVREMCWRMNSVPYFNAEVPYCGYAAFKKDGKKQILIKAHL